MKCTRALALALLLAVVPAFAAGDVSNREVRALMRQDQAAREMPFDRIDWKKVNPQDAARRGRVRDILRHGGLRTSEDYGNAALIYQHGDTADEIRMAHALATIAVTLDPGNKPAKWLIAASWDRIMMRLKKPQWYGTQFYKADGSPRWELYPVDEKAVTDQQRKEYGVPSLAESRARADGMNGAAAGESPARRGPHPPLR